jgi:DNA-binding transcriptional MerR regulator
MDSKKDHKEELAFLEKLIVGIGEVSEITEIPQRQIRYWESKGYISSVKRKSTTRRYNYRMIKKMLLIKELLDEGYTLESAVKKVDKRFTMVDNAFKKLKTIQSK